MLDGEKSIAGHRGKGWSNAFLWTAASQAVQGMARIGLSVAVAQFAGKELLGLTTSSVSLATFLVLCWPQAAGVAATRFIAAARTTTSDTSSLARSLRAIAILPSLVLGAAAVLIAHQQVGTGWRMSVTTGLLVVTQGAAAVTRGIRSGRQQFLSIALWDAVGAVLGLVVLLALLASGHDALALLALCASALPVVLTGLTWRSPRSRYGRRSEIVSFTAWTSAHIITAGGLLPALTLVAATMVDRQQLGDFAAAASIATPLYLLSTAMRVSFEPFLAREYAQGDHDGVRRSIDQLMRAMVALFVPLAGVIALWSDAVLSWLYPSAFASARPTLLLLVVGVGLTCLNAAHAWLSATRTWGPRVLTAANTAGLIAGLGVGAYAGHGLGATGVALGMVAGSFVSTTISTVAVWRADSLRWAGVTARAAVGCLMFAGSVAVQERYPGPVVLALMTATTLVVWLRVDWADLRTVNAWRGQHRTQNISAARESIR